MGPDHVAARRGVGRFEQVNPADFLVAQQAEEGDDQVALFIRQKKPVAVFYQKGIGPARFLPAAGVKGFPHPLAGVRFQATPLAVAATPVYDVAVTYRMADTPL